MDNVFDLLDRLAALQRLRAVEQRVHTMPEWEKEFFLGYLKYIEAHPDVLDDPHARPLPMDGTDAHQFGES